MKEKPKMSNSESQKQIDKAAEQFDAYDSKIKEMTLDRMNAAPKQEIEAQTQLSQKDLDRSKETYLKPMRTIGGKDKFNERLREKWEFAKEYVRFIAENNEIIGETIELWTKPFPGVPAEFWNVPVNKPVWGPRYLAERIKGCSYHKFTMQQSKMTSADGMGQYYGGMVVDSIVQRLDARPAKEQKSIFIGSSNF